LARVRDANFPKSWHLWHLAKLPAFQKAGNFTCMNASPHVSVILPTYNRCASLLEAIDSVAGQTFQDFEIIVADDGSTDETAERLAVLSVPIRAIRLEHSGRPGTARNRALAVARGDLLAFLDDDDRWQPAKLARQVALLDSRPAVGFAYHDFQLVDAGSGLSKRALSPGQKLDGFIFDALIHDCFLQPSTVVVRRSLLEESGPFDETLEIVEDYELWLRLARLAPAGYIDEPLATVYRHSASHSRQRDLLVNRNTIAVLEQAGRQPNLSPAQRLRFRRALARAHTRLALFLIGQGQAGPARRQLFSALRTNPLLLRAWLTLASTFQAGPKS
jgi:glycosyltransferase involved in cell wall biosynthesis